MFGREPTSLWAGKKGTVRRRGEKRRGEEVRKFHLETGEEVFKEDILPGQLSQQRLAPVLLHQLAVYRNYWVSPLLIAAQYSFPFQPSMMTTLLSSLSTAFLLHLTSFVSTLFDLSHFITMAAREQLVSSDCSVQLKNSCFLANNDLCKVQRIQCR